MRVRAAFSATLLIPEFFRRLRVPVGLLLAATLLAACGGGSDGDDVELIDAFAVLGQSGFSDDLPNRGGAAGAGTLAQPLGNIAVSGDVLFIADTANNRILGYRSLPINNGAAADFVLGQVDFTATTGGTAVDRMALPASAYVGEGRLIVADSGNNRVLVWNDVPTESGTPPDVVVGQTDFNGGTSGTTASTLRYPTSAIISNGRLVVADQNNNRVLVWNSVPDSNGMPADLVLGQRSFTTRIADDAEDEMDRPASLWSDGFRLLVADTGNNRVLYWSLFPQDSGDAADYVLGQSDFNRSAAGTSSISMRAPFGVTSDGTRVYIADSGNNRILQFSAFPIANGIAASKVYGQDGFARNTPNDDDQDGEVDDNPTQRVMNGVSGVHSHSGVLYATDRNNHRILLFPQ
jgi:hypothetical protein